VRSKAGDPRVTRAKDCTACSRDCAEVFVCTVCHFRKNVCWNLTGGFDSGERVCSQCYDRTHLPQSIYDL